MSERSPEASPQSGAKAEPSPVDPLLRMRGISKRFGATVALDGVDLEVHSGRVLALIGENGAGKSTLMKVLSGAHSPDRGRMELAGHPYRPSGPVAARAAGVAMIYQELNLAPQMSVEDNIMLGREQGLFGVLERKSQRRRVRRALQLLGHPGLRPEIPVERLSVAMQQLVEIARALVFDARVVVFDEPTSSLTRRDVDHLFGVIRKLRKAGKGIIYISHFLEEVREVCDEYAVLRDGRSVGQGSLKDAAEQQIVSLMVGRNVDELFPKVPHQPGETIVQIDNLSGQHRPKQASLELRRGEILGLAGLVGAGRTELLRCLFGLDPIKGGQVQIVRRNKIGTGPPGRIRAGMGLVSEDRKGEGLALNCSIIDNMTWSDLRDYNTLGLLNLPQRRSVVQKWIGKLAIRAANPGQPVGELSGGNQQKVAIARVLHQQAEILLLDEPTRGIDVGTKAEIYRLMGELAAEGRSLLFVSSYIPELLAVCDRIAVMSRGRIGDVRPAANWTEEAILATAISGEAEEIE